MPFNPSGLSQGYIDYRQQTTNQDYIRAIMAGMALAQEATRRKMAARQAVGPVLGTLAQQPGMEMGGGQLPAPPGTTPGPMPPGVGVSSLPAPPQGTPAAATAPAAAPAPPPPYQALPQPPMAGPQAGPGQISAPPGAPAPMPPAPAPAPAAAPAAAAPAVAEPRPYNLPNIIKAMKANGVPDAQMMDMLDELQPVMNAQNQMELSLFKAHLTAAQKAEKMYIDTINALTNAANAGTRRTDVENRDRERTRQNDIRERDLERKLQQQVGGPDNLKRTDFTRDADGNITGVVGVTKSGKIIRLDMEGNPQSGAPEPGGGPKADQNRVREINSLRGELSTLSNLQLVGPTPQRKARMDAIEKRLRDYGAAAKPVTPGASADGGETPPTDPAQREINKVYTLPRGKFKWTAAGWVQP